MRSAGHQESGACSAWGAPKSWREEPQRSKTLESYNEKPAEAVWGLVLDIFFGLFRNLTSSVRIHTCMYPHVTSVKSLGLHLELLGSNKSFKKWDLVGEIIGSLKVCPWGGFRNPCPIFILLHHFLVMKWMVQICLLHDSLLKQWTQLIIDWKPLRLSAQILVFNEFKISHICYN